MKLVRCGPAGKERPAILHTDGSLRDVSGIVSDITADAFARGALEQIAAVDAATLPAITGAPRLGAPLSNVGKIVCVGLNYRAHASEAEMQAPAEPVLFMKATTAISGPYDDVVLPHDAVKTDWEVELGVVIGARASRVTPAEAHRHIAGYVIVNDVSDRAYQLERGGQWMKGKSCDTFAPIGPWFVSADEIPDPQALSLELSVNDVVRQKANTSDMIFPVTELVSYISRFMSLAPGDIVSTGTPEGVGMGLDPQVYLKPGDEMRLRIEGLGEQRQRVVALENALAPEAARNAAAQNLAGAGH